MSTASSPTTLDLYYNGTLYRWVSFTKAFPTSGHHTLKLVNLADLRPAKLYIDGFATVREA